ncbi:Organic cation transporter protein [Armadillidium vulgare]|nr:Organic cation transporter protein [Armadillidium vulgare]
MYITLKIIISITTSSFYMVGIILVLELCSKNQRSYVGALFALPWAFGYMVLPGIAYFIRSFFYLQIAITLPILTLFPIFCILPESPRWLVLKGKFDEALLILEGISNHNKRELPSKLEIFTLMSTICEKQKIGVRSSATFLIQIKKTFYKLYKMWTIKKWRLRLPVLFFGWFACSLVYYGVSLNPPDLSIELIPTEFRSVILGEASVCGKFGSFFSPYIVDLLREAKEWVPSAIFGGVSLIAGCLMVFLPETRDQNLAESTEKTEIISKKVQEDQ